STEQLYVAEGVAQKTDIGFELGGGGGGWGGFGAAAGGGYGNTEIGKVITAAYFNAFVDLVGYLQHNAPSGAQVKQAAGVQAFARTGDGDAQRARGAGRRSLFLECQRQRCRHSLCDGRHHRGPQGGGRAGARRPGAPAGIARRGTAPGP